MEQSVDRIFCSLGVISARFTLSDNRAIGRTRGGDLHPTSYGTPLWFGSFTIRTYKRRLIGAVEARMETLLQTDGTFLLSPPASRVTTITTGSVTFISASDRRVMRAGTASPVEGDWIGVVYDGGRRGLHRVAARNGVDIILTSPLALGVAVGNVLTFGRPALRAVVDAGGYSAPNFGPANAKGLSLDWTQTLSRAP